MKHLLLAGAVALALSASASAASITEANDAYAQNRMAEAEQQFSEIAADPDASAHDRHAALLELARIDWLLRGETDAAERALAQAAAPDRCAIATLALRIYREAGAPATPLAAIAPARADCTPDAADALRVQAARAHLALATGRARQAHLDQAAAELSAIAPIAAGMPSVASTRLAVALARRDASAAYDAWCAYFWLTDSDTPQAMSAYAGHVRQILDAGLARRASAANQVALAAMLARAGFVDDARTIAEDAHLATRAASHADWPRLAALFAFDARVDAVTLRANRLMASGQAAPDYEDEVRAAVIALAQANGRSGDPLDVLPELYGLYGSLGMTSGYPGLHAGYIAEDRTIATNQYGHHGELRFIVLDNMIANGFESWLWDGSAQAGGWARDDVIVQVRSAYTAGPVSALRRFRPGPTRDRFLARIERNAERERQALEGDAVAPLPATSDRLEMQALEQIAQRVGDSDEAFVAEVWRATNQYSIEMHEGRHVIDKARGEFSSAELEFMAKLSEIALPDYPRLALSNVVGQSHGDTPHGAANRRVLTGYRDWMQAHAAEIPGFDPSTPTLSQLTLLSDAQIVAAAQSMDDLARAAH